MRTELCDLFEIDVPIFAFTHCRDVVVEVSKAGGFGVLGAVGFSPDQLETELRWIDEQIGDKPYGVDTVIPNKYEGMGEFDAEKLEAQLRASVPQEHRDFAAKLLARGLEQEVLRTQVRAILEGLTPREQEVTWYTARGYTNHQIAETLVVSIETVKTHVRHVLEKLGVHSKADLRLLLLNLGIRWWEGLSGQAPSTLPDRERG